MGNVKTITATDFPKQGPMLGLRTKVIFHYGGPELLGTIVRDDYEEPWRTIIKLDDGRYILGSECQHAPVIDAMTIDETKQFKQYLEENIAGQLLEFSRQTGLRIEGIHVRPIENFAEVVEYQVEIGAAL